MDQEAGIGFSPHNDTQATLTWSPFPLVSIMSRVRYQKRVEDDWQTRNHISWSPLRGGVLILNMSGHYYYDSKNDAKQSGAGIVLTWRPRPRLTFEGNWVIKRFEEAGDIRVPFSGGVRAVWTF